MQLRNTALRAPRQLGRGRVGVCLLLCVKRLACRNLTSSELNSSTPAWRRQPPSLWWRTSGRPSARRRGSWRPLRRRWPAREMLWWQVLFCSVANLCLSFGPHMYCWSSTRGAKKHSTANSKNLLQTISKIDLNTKLILGRLAVMKCLSKCFQDCSFEDLLKGWCRFFRSSCRTNWWRMLEAWRLENDKIKTHKRLGN